MSREQRRQPITFRDVRGSGGRQKWATAVTYRTVDSYGTTWTPGVFNDGFSVRMPTILYGHDWNSIDSVLGVGIDHRDSPSGVDVLIEFADPKLVPSAGLAIALTSGPNPALKEVSVGFDRIAWRSGGDLSPDELTLGATEAMDQASLDELSLVVRGAVDGAQLRSKKGAPRMMSDVRERRELEARHRRGELTRGQLDLELQILDAIAQAEEIGRGYSRPRPRVAESARTAKPALAPVPERLVVLDAEEQLRRSLW